MLRRNFAQIGSWFKVLCSTWASRKRTAPIPSKPAKQHRTWHGASRFENLLVKRLWQGFAVQALQVSTASAKVFASGSGSTRRIRSCVLVHLQHSIWHDLRQNGLALKFAADHLAADAEIALAAISQCGRAFQYCADLLQADRAFVLSAVKANGHSLKYVPEQLQDEEIVGSAVDQCGHALGDILDNGACGPSVQRRIRHVLQNKGVLGFEQDAAPTVKTPGLGGEI